MATLAIQVGIAVGVSLLSNALAPKPKLQPVDRGKLDDIRFTVMEEGAFKPLVYGRRARLGGLLRWGTETQEYVTSTPGRSGGKGGGSRQAQPPTNNYTYRKSFAILFAGNRVKRYRRLWEDGEVLLNLAGTEGVAGSYEAESDANTLTNASLADSTAFSGGRGVQLNVSTGAVQFNSVGGFGSATEFAFAYIASGTRTCQVWVNGSLAATLTLPGNSGAYSWYTSTTIDIPAGAGNTVKLVNSSPSGGALLYVDLLRVSSESIDTSGEPGVTGVVDESNPYPTDLARPHTFYNRYPANDAQGVATGTLAAGGQAPFEFYTGTETQLQSPTIVAAEGAENTPAWRSDSYVVFNDYLVKGGGQLGNFTAEVEPWIQDLADVMTDLYLQDGRAAASELDFSSLAGTLVEGFVVHTRQDLGSWVDQLQLWYNFDVVPVGGKIVAVKRGGASSFTLTEADLYAHHDGEERPRGALRRTIEDPADAPASVDVLYLDYSSDKDFHTGGQQAQAQAGQDSYDHDTLTFAVISDAETATAVGARYLDAKALEQKPFEFSTGPAWRHLTPGDVGTIVLPEGSHFVRLTSRQAELQGLVKFRAVPERPSIYSHLPPGLLFLGRENPVVAFPANTLLVVADCVALRQEDYGRLVLYSAGCPLGRGAWPGYALHKQDLDTEYERVAGFEDAATIGVIETASNGTTTAGYHATRSFVVKLYHGSLESRSVDDVLAAKVNLAIYGDGSRWEALQFLTVEAQAPTFPFVAQYLVTGTFSGLYGSGRNSRNHQDGDFFVLVDGALKSFPVPATQLSHALTFVGQTPGQAFADAEAVSSVEITWEGVSVKTVAPTYPRSFRDSVSTYFTSWVRQGRNAGELRDYAADTPVTDEKELYGVEIFSPAFVFKRRVVIDPHVPHPPALGSFGALTLTGNTLTSVLGGGVAWTARPVFQSDAPGDFFVEATFRHNGTFTEYFGLSTVPPSAAGGARPACDFEVQIEDAIGGARVKVYERGALVSTDLVFTNTIYFPRLRFRVRNGRVAVFRVFDGSAAFSEAQLYEFSVTPSTLYAYFEIGGGSYAADIHVLDHVPTFVYPKAEQQGDFGSPQATPYLRIYQLSTLVGRGYPLDIVIDSAVLPAATGGECGVTETEFIA